MPIPVPEHSVPLMTCLSGGEALREDGYLFLLGGQGDLRSASGSGADDDAGRWLMGIGYREDDDPDDPERFAAALTAVRRRVRADDYFCMAPLLPANLLKYRVEEDVFYNLPAAAPVPVALKGPLRRAGELLRVEESKNFSAAHRRLWAEFMRQTPLKARVRRLYAATERLVRDVPGAFLLDACDENGHLAASLVLDRTLPGCISYIIGAHSRAHYTPHASDLLFAAMLELARREGREHLLLGLGVNAGITRFKRKWGGCVGQPYQLAVWRESAPAGHVDAFMKALMSAPADMSKRQILASLPEQQPFAMLWRLEKNGRTSWIGGAAHFFCCSFEHSLRNLFERVDTVLFEGPLDPESLDAVARCGQTPEPGSPRAGDFLSEAEVQGLSRVVNGPCPRLARLVNSSLPPAVDVRHRIAHTRPWYAFFSLWTAYLERNGWANSVDMDAWNLALDMGKAVLGMESLAEQIASLESAPLPRIVRFLQNHGQWRKLKNNNQSAYLWGNLTGMLGTSAEFPTRTENIIDVRDQRFRERMRARVEQGGVAVFVGSAHMLNLRRMLAEDGFTVIRELPTWKHRLRAWWLHDPDVVLLPPQGENSTDVPALADVPAATAAAPSAAKDALIPARIAGGSRLGAGEQLEWLTATARIPEHILSYVRHISPSSTPVLRECGGFAAWVAGASLVLVGFDPDEAPSGSDGDDFSARLAHAVTLAVAEPGIERLTVLAPEVPANAPAHATVRRDIWWGVSLPAAPGQKTRNMIRRAQREVSISREAWGAEHAALVTLYLSERTDLSPGTRALFGQLYAYVEKSEGAVLLAARSLSGELAGFLVGDISPLRTAFYLYAFRRPQAPPGTSDALLDALARLAEAQGHERLNLGLGVREGIVFFKQKWRAQELGPHVESSWTL